MRKYRIDRAYEKVYVSDPGDKAFFFFCNFVALAANNKMNDSEIIARCNAKEEEQILLEEELSLRKQGLI